MCLHCFGAIDVEIAASAHSLIVFLFLSNFLNTVCHRLDINIGLRILCFSYLLINQKRYVTTEMPIINVLLMRMYCGCSFLVLSKKNYSSFFSLCWLQNFLFRFPFCFVLCRLVFLFPSFSLGFSLESKQKQEKEKKTFKKSDSDLESCILNRKFIHAFQYDRSCKGMMRRISMNRQL